MTPTGTLREEHRVILKALAILEAAAHRLTVDEPLPEDGWQALLEWLRAFADARHHAKEEKVLFPAMTRAGLPSEGGPIGVMVQEHVLARALIAGMADAPPAHRAAQAQQYIGLLREHIDKENLILFPLADEVLDAHAVERVRRDFESVDLEQSHAASIEVAEREVDELALKLSAPVAAG